MKSLNDTYVLVGRSSDNIAPMINQVIGGHQISFYDENLPFQGRLHNKELHIIVIFRERIINCVLVDDGSGLNICPRSTLRKFRLDLWKLEQKKSM